MGSSLQYQIALTLLPGVGAVSAKNLLAYCGSGEEVFKAQKKELEKIPGIGTHMALAISTGSIQTEALKRADEELRFMEMNKVSALFFTDKDYPVRLKECSDSPVLIYYKGNANLNAKRIISVVGSRRCTEYGRMVCDQLINALSSSGAMVVSGLAYGIDICAHRAALKEGLATVGVLAHGLDKIYPSEHRSTALKMQEQGGLLTEFYSNTKMNPEYFPRRNRIVAGISDATLVIEANAKSGALITAEIANSYDRDVFAVPGKLGDPASEGCNLLIKANKAMLIQGADDVIKALNWDLEEKKNVLVQQELFEKLSEEEKSLLNAMREKGQVHIDDLSHICHLPVHRISTLLLNLEFNGSVRSLPGKMYRLNH